MRAKCLVLAAAAGLAAGPAASAAQAAKDLFKGNVKEGLYEVKSYRQSPGGASLVTACKDGSSTDMKFAFGGNTFTSEMRTTGTQEGKSFVSVFRSEAKHIGPCPAPKSAPPAAKK